jgi:hypothetical protein
MTIGLEAGKITIIYRDGRSAEGLVLARYGDTLSVAVRDADDAALFTRVHGTWISEECEPVDIQTDWHGHTPKQPVSEGDCICSEELASRLIQRLFNGDESECDEPVNYERSCYAPLSRKVV